MLYNINSFGRINSLARGVAANAKALAGGGVAASGNPLAGGGVAASGKPLTGGGAAAFVFVGMHHARAAVTCSGKTISIRGNGSFRDPQEPLDFCIFWNFCVYLAITLFVSLIPHPVMAGFFNGLVILIGVAQIGVGFSPLYQWMGLV